LTEAIGKRLPVVALPFINAAQAEHPAFQVSVDRSEPPACSSCTVLMCWNSTSQAPAANALDCSLAADAGGA
jgi:hypothetical protein